MLSSCLSSCEGEHRAVVGGLLVVGVWSMHPDLSELIGGGAHCVCISSSMRPSYKPASPVVMEVDYICIVPDMRSLLLW